MWSGQNGRSMYVPLFATINLAQNHPATVERFIQALVDAEEFATNNKTEALNLIARHFNYDDAYMRAIMPKFKFTVSFDQAMLISMEDQARWAMQNKLTDKTAIPKYRDYMYIDALKKIKPDAVLLR